ncbi:MAG: hypothetical protein BWY87_01129 [Deltaproteobacteria bacterium ADurb.Bin510]|jgi:predicted nucleotidyltransferase|nr:MAG: hypothetical protein BWY87_01129 [Deltaproteobacteria bacterium ADurb.Bin510]
MNISNCKLDWLAPKPARAVAAFSAALEAALGDRLVCLALTGSVVSGDFVEGVSDINSVVIVKDLDRATLERLAQLGRRHGKRGIHAPLVLTADAIASSLDVFPIEFLELRLAHRVILGAYDFAAPAIDAANLRLQLERELKARLINLRQGYLSASGDSQRLAALLLSAYKGFFPLLRAYLHLKGQTPPLRRCETLAAARQASGLAFACFEQLEGLSRARRPRLKEAQATALFESLYETTHALADQVDRHLA